MGSPIRRLRRVAATLTLGFALAAPASSRVVLAAETGRARVDAIALADTPNALRVNGEVSDAVWQRATAIDAFVQRDPEEGGTPSQRTEFRVAYDSSTLFVQVHAFDAEAGRIVGFLTRRDGDSPSDWIRILIDSYHDRRTAYEFAVNPAGVKQDRYWFNDNNRDDSWDAVWDVKVSRDESGWTAEFRIPFSQLRFTPTVQNTFGFAVSRQIGRLNETSTWPLLARSANGYVSSFGELGGLSMTTAPKRMELLPYSVGNVTVQPTDGNPLIKSPSPAGAVGMDVKYALTPGLTLSATINPDFGQVEADPAVVNLSAFETFFSERRPFFVEGSGNFRFDSDCPNGPCQLFYSRRVGRSPQGLETLPSGDGVYTDAPLQTTILGAGKLTGRVGKFSIGVMHAVTQEEHGEALLGAQKITTPIEPLTNYSLARVRREFANQSAVGFLVTSTNRSLSTPLLFLPKNAFTGGVDVDLRFKTRYSLAGYWAASSVRGDPVAIDRIQENSRHYYQRPDSDALELDPSRTALNGTSGRIGIKKIGGQRVRFDFNGGFKSPGFDVNELGFIRRADERWTANWLQIRSEKPSRWLRSRYLNFNAFYMWNADGDAIVRAQNVNGNVNFKNNWSAGGGVGLELREFDDRLTRGGPGAYAEGYRNFWSWLNTDNRKPLSLSMFSGAGRNGVGGWFRENNVDLTYRPMSAITVATGLQINRSASDHQWVELVTDSTGHYVFANIKQTTYALTERLNYTMTPNLSLQLYAQPFVSGGDYGGFKELVNGRSLDYDGRYSPYAYGSNPDFNYKSFRTTNVLRWEYRPGSTMFVVWQQSRDGSEAYGDVRFSRDFGRIFNTPARNVVLVKFSYWLNY
jgi:uncharacterized protein DUF5916/cellulose/xylan binding protein with CBM9 domain